MENHLKFNGVNSVRVSEVVTIEQIENWGKGDCITIKAGTGAGKSYFIKNNLYALAKRDNRQILMLVHRSNCATQFKSEIIRDGKTDVIQIMTYQKLENLFLHSPQDISLWQYQYIVCDEFHYFMGDAAWSKTTDISLDMILKEKSAIKIFMSATGDYMKKYINEIKQIPTTDYELPITYNAILNLNFFNKDETLDDIIEAAITNNHKAVFFIQSASKAYSLYQKYKDKCIFNCSKSNPNYYRYVDNDKINAMLSNEKFDEQVLITTTCLDAGVNIIDLDLKYVVCDVEDTGTLIQCVGRKRIQNDNDKFDLFVKTISNKALGGKETKLNTKIAMAEFLKEHTVKEFIVKYPREYDINNIVYDVTVSEDDKGTKKVNDLMFFKCKVDMFEIKTILEKGKNGYCRYIMDLFGIELLSIIEEDYRKSKFERYLEKSVGKKLYKEEQKQLAIEANIKRNGKLMKSYNSLNACFLEDNINYFIKSETKGKRKFEDGSINPNYRKVFWMVYKLDTNTDFGCEAI